MLDFDTVTLDEERDELIIIDQTRLPNETVFYILPNRRMSGMLYIH